MPFETEYTAVGEPPPRPATRAAGRLLLGTIYAASKSVIEHLNAQVVFAVGLGYATNAFPEGFALISPAKYVNQELPPPYGPTGQPISSITGAG